MTTIAKALDELNVANWVGRGNDPTNELEFYNWFEKTLDDGTVTKDPTYHNVTWRWVSQKQQELIDAEPMRLLRAERDRLIAETDWWALSDLTITQAQIDYRQALRDITKTQTPAVDANGNLTGVTWPTKP